MTGTGSMTGQTLNFQILIEDNDLNSKDEIAYGPSKDLPNVTIYRTQLLEYVFLLNTEISLDCKESEECWPHVNNIWVHN